MTTMGLQKRQRVEVMAGCGRWDLAVVTFVSYRVTPAGQPRPERPVIQVVYVQRDIDPRGFESAYNPEHVRPVVPA